MLPMMQVCIQWDFVIVVEFESLSYLCVRERVCAVSAS